MRKPAVRSPFSLPPGWPRPAAAVCCAALALVVSAWAQQPASRQPAAASPAQAPQGTSEATTPATARAPGPDSESAQAVPTAPAPPAASRSASESRAITEDELKHLLVGKLLYLRNGYLDDTLDFNEQGRLIGRSPQGSYTLSAIEIGKVHLGKHKVELEGIRYGLHFVGQLPYEDPATATDRVRITPPKKAVKISIDREIVLKLRKDKRKEKAEKKARKKEKKQTASATAPARPSLQQAPKAQPGRAAQPRASANAAPASERPAGANSSSTTTSPAHAAQTLRQAIDNVFAFNVDARMISTLPECWKLYYQAVAARKDWQPADPSILRQETVDRKARLLDAIEPDSNAFAQANGIAGLALYHVVVGADGRAAEIAVARPIGFGLDENAVAAIRKARFQPAIKNGKPVPVLVDMVIEFRIYDQRTSASAPTPPPGKKSAPVLPGPYSLPQP